MSEPMSDERLAEFRSLLFSPGGRRLYVQEGVELFVALTRLRARVAEMEAREGRVLPDPKGGCICWLPSEMWDTSYYGIPEPGSQMEYDPACPEHSVHLYNPRLGEWRLRDKYQAADDGGAPA